LSGLPADAVGELLAHLAGDGIVIDLIEHSTEQA
jgi:hypothetical protein